MTKAELWEIRATVFFVLYAFFAIPLYFQMIQPQLAFSRRGAQVQGRIVAIEPENNYSIRYEYQVDGANFSGIAGRWPRRVDVGDPVLVTYLRDERDVSMAGEPRVQGWWQLLFVILPIISAVMAELVARAGRKKGWPPPRY